METYENTDRSVVVRYERGFIETLFPAILGTAVGGLFFGAGLSLFIENAVTDLLNSTTVLSGLPLFFATTIFFSVFMIMGGGVLFQVWMPIRHIEFHFDGDRWTITTTRWLLIGNWPVLRRKKTACDEPSVTAGRSGGMGSRRAYFRLRLGDDCVADFENQSTADAVVDALRKITSGK